MNVTEQTERIERSAGTLARRLIDNLVRLADKCDRCREFIPRGQLCAQHDRELLRRLTIRIRDLAVRASVAATETDSPRVDFEVNIEGREAEPCDTCGAPIIFAPTGRVDGGRIVHAPYDQRTELPTETEGVVRMENHHARCPGRQRARTKKATR